MFKTRDARWQEWQRRAVDHGGRTDFHEKWWFADAAAIRANDFNLSEGSYRPMNRTAIEHRDPRELLDELAAIEVEIAEEVEALRMVLSN